MAELITDDGSAPSLESVRQFELDCRLNETVTLHGEFSRRILLDVLNRLGPVPHEDGDIAALQDMQFREKLREIARVEECVIVRHSDRGKLYLVRRGSSDEPSLDWSKDLQEARRFPRRYLAERLRQAPDLKDYAEVEVLFTHG